MSMEELDIIFFLLKHWGSNFVNSKAESILYNSRFLSVFLAEFILTAWNMFWKANVLPQPIGLFSPLE